MWPVLWHFLKYERKRLNIYLKQTFDVRLALHALDMIPKHTRRISYGARPGVWGMQSNQRAPKIFACLNTSASLRQSLGITQKLLHFLGQENGYFCWSNFAIFQGITKQFKTAFYN